MPHLLSWEEIPSPYAYSIRSRIALLALLLSLGGTPLGRIERPAGVRRAGECAGTGSRVPERRHPQAASLSAAAPPR